MMGKKLYSIEVRGNEKVWSFYTYLNPDYIKNYLDDGLMVTEVLYTVPQIAVDLRMVGVWCFFQDVFNFRNPFK